MSQMRPLAVAVAKSGLLDEEMVAEFLHWGLPVEHITTGHRPQSTEDLVMSLEEALQSEGLVVERVTDLEVVRQYLATQTIGLLHLEIGEEFSEFNITFGKSKTGMYIVPWKGENVAEEMANGKTYLVEGTNHIYFRNVSDLFFGETKAFMLLSPSTVVSLAK